jgi:hypothetical protein
MARGCGIQRSREIAQCVRAKPDGLVMKRDRRGSAAALNAALLCSQFFA